MLPADWRHCDGSKGGVTIAEVDRTMTNGMRLEGHVMVPNLGYKKDAFLEPSLISNFLTDTPITHTPTTMSPTCHTNRQACRQPNLGTPSPSSSNGLALRRGIIQAQPSTGQPFERDSLSHAVMDMVIFRTIFFELFSFLHIHVPYPPISPANEHKEQNPETTVIRMADNMVQQK